MLETLPLLLLKLTAWCALPFLLRPLLMRCSAARRHLTLTLVLLGAVLLPTLGSIAPIWTAPIGALPELAQAALAPASAAPATAGEPALRRNERSGRHASVEPRAEGARPREGSRSAVWSTAEPPRATVEPQPSTFPVPLATLLVGLWLVGSALIVLRTALAVQQTRRVVHGARPIEESRATTALVRARQRLGGGGEPHLCESPHTRVPFAWSGRRAALVLPTSWQRWDRERLTLVLVHELAHLLRRDAVALWAGRAAIALWWFHPLVHSLDRWARKECEQAADDAVLRSGSRASEYADHLIAIGRALPRPLPAGVSLMMSNRPDLKQRLLAILSAHQPRQGVTQRLVASATAVACASVIALAGVHFSPQAHAQEVYAKQKQKHKHKHTDGHHESKKERDPGEQEWEQAFEAHGEGRYDEAIAGFEAAAAAGFRPDIAIYNVACGYAQSGRHGEALAALRRAFELGLDDPELLAEDSDLDPLRADATFQALVDDAFAEAGEKRDPIEHHRYRNGQEALQMLRDSGSQNAKAWLKAGTSLLSLRQLDDASEALDTAARLEREDPSTAYYNLACAHALAGHEGEALDALEQAIGSGFDDAEHMRQDPDLRSLRESSRFEQLAELAGALDLDRYRHALWEKRHAKHGDHGDEAHGDEHHGDEQHSEYSIEAWASAIDFYRGFVREHPSMGAGWFNLGYALHFSRRFDESIDAFGRARELGFRPSVSTYNVACGHSMLNRVDPAFAALEEAIELGIDAGQIEGDDDLENLHQDSRFRKLLLSLKLERKS